MVKVKFVILVVSYVVQGSFSRPQEESTTQSQSSPKSINYDNYDYYTDVYDYTQYGDYGKQYGDYGKQYDDYVKQYNDYVKQYGDYGKQKQYGDYGAQYVDYDHDHVWHYEDEYSYYDDDYTTDYSEYFVFGDRNNPLDTIVHVYDDTGVANDVPWVYIIVPVVQIDVLYVDPEHEAIADVETEFPIETFIFELGSFGLGHFDLGEFGSEDFRKAGNYGGDEDYGLAADYGSYDDYPVYGHYQGARADLFDTADELSDEATLDYPGLDHDPYWIDWIFMVPPDEFSPQRR